MKNTKDLKTSSKILLSYIIELYGMDFAKVNGYVYRTNTEILKDTEIKQKRTLIDAARELELKGYITRIAGQRVKGEKNKASEYHLKGEMLQYALPNTPLNTPLNTPSQYETLLLKINELEERIKVLELQNTVLNTVSNTPNPNTPSQNMKYTSDIDIDKEIELETNDNNDNTEEYNIKDQNEKEIITEDNLEILKENEILNDEIPSDLPILDVDSFVEISNNENISDSDSSKNELEFSIFGNDIISEDENDNDTTVKFINGKFTVVSETEDEINSSSDVEQDNEILNDSNSSDMIMNNSSDTISNNENLSNNDNFEIWGKLQPIYGKTSNVITEYLFTEYENLNDSKNVSDVYHQVKQYISLGKEQINVSVNQTGSFGILSFNNNVYSFIACNSNIISDSSDTISERCIITPNHAAAEKTSNDADTAVKMSQVDNYTTDTENVAPVQPQTANKTYTNPDPNNPKVWEYIKLHLTMKQGSHLMRDVLDEYKEIEAKNIHSIIAYMEDMCKAVRSALEKGLINEMQFNDFKRVFQTLSKGKYNYWRKVFSTRSPKSLMSSEMKMWGILGKPKVVNCDDETSKVDNNKVYEDNVILPTEKDFESMNLDEIKNTLLTFIAEHPNLSDNKKAYINDLCIAYTLEPQYVA
ncbi:hypothetical protein [uncultured Prevotella sp.]|uniref:hypothetical protein n=1 Tax=uncultured Prevotella sp. TaxID=159272 RepID=UPI002665CAEC|nr:hypothetical protein [uncultured Prevotella sp.]